MRNHIRIGFRVVAGRRQHHAVGDDLGGVLVLTVLVLPLSGLQAALNVDLAALLEVLARDLGELPGIAKDKIEVNVEDRNVTIGAEFLNEVDANGKSLWQERSFGKTSRSIRLPESVDANAAVATHVDGVLQLTLPKIAKTNAKQITIQ